MKHRIANKNTNQFQQMDRIELDYLKEKKMELSPHYYVYGLIGLVVGGITYLKIELSDFWNVVVSGSVAAFLACCGAAGKYFFDKKGKKWMDKLFNKKKKRK